MKSIVARLAMLCVSLVLISLIVLWSADSALSQEPKLVARWPLDEESGDIAHEVIGGFDGELVGGDADWVEAKFGNGIQFEGPEGKAILIPRVPELELKSSLTVILWVNFNAVAGRQELFFLANNLGINYNGNLGVFIWRGEWTSARGQTAAQIDEWYFVAATYDGKDLKLYVNGELAASADAPGEIIYQNPDSPFVLGGQADAAGTPTTGRQLYGILDEVEVWDKSMTDDQIREAYESPPPSIAVSPKGRLTATWGELKLR